MTTRPILVRVVGLTKHTRTINLALTEQYSPNFVAKVTDPAFDQFPNVYSLALREDCWLEITMDGPRVTGARRPRDAGDAGSYAAKKAKAQRYVRNRIQRKVAAAHKRRVLGEARDRLSMLNGVSEDTSDIVAEIDRVLTGERQ